MGCPVIQWQMVVKDPEAESAFYSSLFGWQVSSDNPLGYRVVDTQSAGGIPGGFWPSPPEGHNLVQLFIRVDSVPDYVGAAPRHSGPGPSSRRRRCPRGMFSRFSWTRRAFRSGSCPRPR